VNTDAEKRLADRVLQVLERAKYLHSGAAARQIDPLRDEVGAGDRVENERAEAWVAICALYKILSETPGHRDVSEHWQKATEKTAAWLATIK
jgi:hypothetical protein